MIESQIKMLELEAIKCSRESRQRKKISPEAVTNLAKAIADQGLIHTILVDRSTNTLIAGEHRLLAFKHNRDNNVTCTHPSYKDWTCIPARFAFNVTTEEIEALELLENIKRVNMTWQEEVLAVLRYHKLQEELDPEWGVNRTAEALGLTSPTTSRYLAVARELEAGNPKIIEASALSAAFNIIQRANHRAIQAELATMDKVETPLQVPFNGLNINGSEPAEYVDNPQAIPEPSLAAPILVEDFTTWAATYTGPKFNLIHCDFPYGIGHNKSDQGNAAGWETYDDSEKVYWKLCDALCAHLDNLLLPSAHIVFWLAADHDFHDNTRQFFHVYAPTLDIASRPLIWHKSDNKGILPDPTHGPRYTYETALLMSQGNRQVVQAVANSYAAPTAKSRIHASEKPEPMLRHFFRMLVDEHTIMLDPTCGSGASLRAAAALGAKSVLGLEINPDFAADASAAFTKAQTLRQLSKETSNDQ